MTEAEEQFTKAITETQAEVGRGYAGSIASQLSAAKEISWVRQQRGMGGSFPENTERDIAAKAAVLAERERCAKIVEELVVTHCACADCDKNSAAGIAAKIRGGQ